MTDTNKCNLEFNELELKELLSCIGWKENERYPGMFDHCNTSDLKDKIDKALIKLQLDSTSEEMS